MLVRLAQPSKLVLWAENVRVLRRRTCFSTINARTLWENHHVNGGKGIHPDLQDVQDGGNHMHEARVGQMNFYC